MAKPDTYRITIGRNSETGRFIPVAEAHKHPRTTEVEHIRIPREKEGK